MSETWCPFARRLLLATAEYTVPRAYPVVSIVEHITAGSDSRSWLQYADNASSVTFLIRVEGGVGVVYQFAPLEWATWGNGRFSRNNPYSPKWIRDYVQAQPDTAAGRARVSKFLLASTVSIEHEGVVPSAALYTGPMLETDLRLNRWIADELKTIQRDREHIIGHYQIDHINRPHCPGGPAGIYYPFHTIVGALNMDPDHFFPETNQHVADDFYDFWVAHGGLPIFGYPIRPEKDYALPNGQQIRVQSFERARFERQVDNSITLGLVEAERLMLTGE